MSEEGIPKKYIIIGVAILVAGVYLAGYFTAPSEEILEKPITGKYIGSIYGECKCILSHIPQPNEIYNGTISGQFDGRIEQDGETVYSNLTIHGGNFTGKIISGSYNDTHFAGIVDGTADIIIEGDITGIEKRGIQLPQWIQWLVGAIAILTAFKYLGFLEYLTSITRKGYQIRKTETEIFDDIKTFLRDDWQFKWNKITIRDILREPVENPNRLYFYILMDSHLIKIIYARNNLSAPVKVKEIEYINDKEIIENRQLLKDKAQIEEEEKEVEESK